MLGAGKQPIGSVTIFIVGQYLHKQIKYLAWYPGWSCVLCLVPTSEKYPQKQVLAGSSPSCCCCSASWGARAGVGGAGGGGEVGGGKVTSEMQHLQSG